MSSPGSRSLYVSSVYTAFRRREGKDFVLVALARPFPAPLFCVLLALLLALLADARRRGAIEFGGAKPLAEPLAEPLVKPLVNALCGNANGLEDCNDKGTRLRFLIIARVS